MGFVAGEKVVVEAARELAGQPYVGDEEKDDRCSGAATPPRNIYLPLKYLSRLAIKRSMS